MLPARILFPCNVRRLHEKFESAGVIRNISPLYLMKMYRVDQDDLHNGLHKVTNITKKAFLLL